MLMTMNSDRENTKNSLISTMVTSSSSRRNYKSSNTENNYNANNGKSIDVQENKKLQEKNNRTVLMVIESIVKYLKCYGISSHVKNCKLYIIL